MNDNPDKVHLVNGLWQINTNKDESINEIQPINTDDYLGFSFTSSDAIKYSENCKNAIESFIKRFPIEDIMKMSFDDYAMSPKGVGNDASFCRNLRYDLGLICSMGNAFPATFEIYKDKEGKTRTSPSLEKEFGNDYKSAFSEVKKRIVEFLDAAKNINVDEMNKIQLNSAFKQKLACVYYPNLYFPGAVKEYIRQSCMRLGVVYNANNVFASMRDLVEWKENKKRYL